MSEHDDGGPAFPLYIPGQPCEPDCNCGRCDDNEDELEEGMSLRDYYKAHAPKEAIETSDDRKGCAKELGITLAEWDKNPVKYYMDLIAKYAGMYADAMIREGKRK